TAGAAAERFGIDVQAVRVALERLEGRGRVLEGELLPHGKTREWCDVEVLRLLKRRSLAKLRKQVEPVAAPVFARFLLEWHRVEKPRAGLDALLSVIERLQ